jgi:hypothetical protein
VAARDTNFTLVATIRTHIHLELYLISGARRGCGLLLGNMSRGEIEKEGVTGELRSGQSHST